MNWNAVGASGQIMGSLATFVTVGYVAVQVHNSEIEGRRAIAQTRVERSIQFNSMTATNEHLAAIRTKVIKGLFGPDAFTSNVAFYAAATKLGLREDEAMMLYSERIALWNVIAQTIPYLDELLPADRAQVDSLNRMSLSDPAFLFWYQFARPDLDPEAIRYVEELMAHSASSELETYIRETVIPNHQAEGMR